MKAPQQIAYLTTLSQKVNKLLELLKKQKPGSAYTSAEIRAFGAFPQNDVKSMAKTIRVIQKEALLIPLLTKAKRDDAMYFLHGLSERITKAINAF